ncbi:FAD-dependent oxidoreductase [Gordonia sp. NPDC058843]|uniref:FAD-dependent oxidoreductase n=1 Tax=Gordonia sp. NPDC058843 TaxID=3346648 RepID=UPI00367FD178
MIDAEDAVGRPGDHQSGHDVDTDVLVLGSGVAGSCAALAAAEAGARVVVIEPADAPGGHSKLSTGVFMAGGGDRRSGEAFMRDYLNVVRQAVGPDAVRTYVEHSRATVDWLGDHGVGFHDEAISGGNAVERRSLVAVDFGAGMMASIASALDKASVTTVLRHRATELLQEQGRICGARVRGPSGEDEIRAGSVVLATGGFGADPERLAEYYPSAAACGDWLWNAGHEHNRGDGLQMAIDAGARVVGHDRGLRVLHADFVRSIEATIPGWVILVDAQGRRYVDETSQYGMLAHRTGDVGDRAWAILDAKALATTEGQAADGVADYVQGIPGIARRRSVNFGPAMMREQLASGKAASADTIGELADAVGLPADQLTATVRQYNDGSRRRTDSLGKRPEFLRPLDRPPYLAVEVRPATLVYTACGPAIDDSGRVLDRLGDPIAGLWAAGEVTGGVLGDLYVGSGSAIGAAATIGRMAGSSAASSALAGESAGGSPAGRGGSPSPGDPEDG